MSDDLLREQAAARGRCGLDPALSRCRGPGFRGAFRSVLGGGADSSGAAMAIRLSMFQRLPARAEPVRARHGLMVVPGFAFADAPEADILIVPGGVMTQPLAMIGDACLGEAEGGAGAAHRVGVHRRFCPGEARASRWQAGDDALGGHRRSARRLSASRHRGERALCRYRRDRHIGGHFGRHRDEPASGLAHSWHRRRPRHRAADGV